MREWGHGQACLFCGKPDETRDHLFFCLSLFVHGLARGCEGLIANLTDPDSNGTIQRLFTHHLRVTITFSSGWLFKQHYITYELWREKMREGTTSTIGLTTNLPARSRRRIRSRIMSLKYYDNRRMRGLMQRWFSSRLTRSQLHALFWLQSKETNKLLYIFRFSFIYKFHISSKKYAIELVYKINNISF